MDREKVIKGLECCTFILGKRKCNECPYQKGLPDNGCYQLQDDFHVLLKEQDAGTAYWSDDTGHWIEGDRNGIDPHTRTTGEMIDTFRCSWCGFYQYWKTPFCPNCGAKMDDEAYMR